MGPRLRILVVLFALAAFIILAARFAPKTFNPEPAARAQAVIFPITVTKTDDTNDGTCSVFDCSLREAIIFANADPDYFTINIPAGTYNLSIAGSAEDAAATGDLDITQNLVINGSGAATTFIDGGSLDRVLDVHPNVTVTISDLTVRNGQLDASDVGRRIGGGIRVEDGVTLTLNNSAITGNRIVSLDKGNGGGIGVWQGNVTLNNCVVDNNSTAINYASHFLQGGGGIYQNFGSLSINDSRITNNTSSGGGGIWFDNDNSITEVTLVINRSTISNNAVGEQGFGAGIRLGYTSAALISDSIISENLAPLDGDKRTTGGGIFASRNTTIIGSTISGNTAKEGGGIYVSGNQFSNESILNIINSTISGNHAHEGGGIHDSAANSVRLYNVTITNNVVDLVHEWSGGGGLYFFKAAGNSIEMADTIIAGNIERAGTAEQQVDCKTPFDDSIQSLGFNLIQNPGGCPLTTAAGDQLGVDPMLGPLQDNGGPTLTHALGFDSTAVEGGNPAGCKGPDGNDLAVDQRQIARPQGARCDIGSFELEFAQLSVILSGAGGAVFSSPPGILCGADCEQKYRPGSAVTLTPAELGDGTFMGWGADCTGFSTCTLTMDSNKGATATFADAHAAPGQLNSTFDGDGKLTLSLADDFIDRATSIAVQDDRKILVAGLTDGPNEGMEEDDSFPFLVRFYSNGEVDETFSSTALFTTTRALAGTTIDVGEIVVQPDGRIVLVATFLVGGPGGETQFLVLRYNTDGSLDDGGTFDTTPADTFGTNGKVLTNFSIRNDFARAVSLQTDGKIVVAGEAGDNGHAVNSLFALARYNADGSLDNTFSSDGKLTTEFFSAVADSAHDVLIQPDGKIVVAGGATNDSLCVARFLETGALDPDFSGDGTLVVTTNLGTAFALGRQTLDGKLVVGGAGFLQRLSSDGALDNTLRVLNVAGDSDNTIARINDLSILSNGKILVAGMTDGNFALAVHNPNGTLDASFGDNGIVNTDFGAEDAAHAVAAQGNARIYAAGSSGTDLAVARYGGVNNLFAVSFESLTYDVNEDAGNATVTLKLGNQVQQPVTVNYVTSNGTATAGSDYTATTGTATFNSTETTTTFTIPVTSDSVEETVAETFFVTLASPTNAVLASSTQATVRIQDNPTVIFDPQGDYSIFESQETALITVELGNRESSLPVTVEYRTVANTATEGADYTLTSGTLTFQPGDSSETFSVPLTNDTIDEPDETVTLMLKNPVNASLPTAEQTLTIVDNSRAVVGSFTASEKSLQATVHVQLDKASPTAVSFNYATSAGTATPGLDYTDVSGTITIPAGSSSGAFHIPVFHDEVYDPSETVLITLSNPTNASVSDLPGSLVILDPAIVVTSTAETTQGPSKCTLREAIHAANTDVAVNDCGTNSIQGGGPGGPDTNNFSDLIYVPAGTYTFTTVDNSNYFGNGDGGNALPAITSRVTINGAGAGATIIERAAGAPDMRLFFVVAALHLDGLTIRGGRGNEGGAARVSGLLTLINCLVSDHETTSSAPFRRGGAIFADGGTGVTVRDSTFFNNISSSHGAALAVHTLLTVSGSNFLQNKALGDGGAVLVAGSPGNISGSSFINNSSATGGAIKANTDLTVTDSLISGNVASNTGGGGIYHTGRSLTLLRTTISNNSTTNTGGGGGISGCGNTSQLFVTDSTISGNTALGDGGGICGNNMNLVNTTVSGNSATGNGGGIVIQGGTFEFNSVTITDNTADSDRNSDSLGGGVRANAVPGSLRNTIIAGNRDWVGYPDIYTGSTTATSRGHNLVGNSEGFAIVPVTGDQFGPPANPIDARLGALQFNGGPTRTHALLAGSPALDAGNPAAPGSGGDSAPATDQRSRPRASATNPRADIGAFEFSTGDGADLSLVKSGTPLVAFAGRQITYQLHASNNGSIPLDDVTVADQLPAGLSYVSAVPSQGACNQLSGLVTCDLGQLAPDATAVVSIIAGTPATSGFYTNNANATTSTTESNLSNNNAIFTSVVKLPITVNTTAQTSGSSADCTLSQAIEAANSDAPVGGCVAGAVGADLIVVPAGTYTLTSAPYTVFGQPVGLPLIESEIRIEGAGASTTTIRRDSAAAEFRLFSLYHIPQGTLTLSNLTLANGRAPSGPGGAVANVNGSGPLAIIDCVFSGNTTVNGSGGAINVVGAPVTINNGTFINNVAGGGGHGGAVNMSAQLASSDIPLLTVINSTFTSNSAGGNGGAISGNVIEISGSSLSGNSASSGGAVSGVFLNLVNALVTGNQATLITDSSGGGGGLSYVTVLLTRSTVSGNQSAGGGGGLKGTSTTIVESTVSGNTAVSSGGGVRGGNHVTVHNSTVSGNSAGASGGGISLQGNLFLNNATITNNTADSGNSGAGHAGGGIRADGSSGHIKNSIIAGNHEFRGNVDIYTGPTSIVSHGHNLIGDNSGCNFAPTTGDQFGTSSSPINPLIGPLQNNGGVTQTHALLANSPAIDSANPAIPDGNGNSCLPTDQRGNIRPQDGDNNSVARCDIGALEVEMAAPTPTPTPTATPTPSPNTPVGTNVVVQTENAKVTFAGVSNAGTTTFTPISPNAGELPSGYALCPTCPAFDIATTASYSPPVSVCLAVPAALDQQAFLLLKLMHGENGVFVDRTTGHFTDPGGSRFVCGVVQSLSPFALASAQGPTAADATVSGQVLDGNHLPVAGVVINLNGTQNRKTITDANGNYQFDRVETAGFYTVTPSRVNYTFNPFNRSFSQLGNQTEAAFTASPSSAIENPLNTPEYFVRQHYLDFLGREPDEAGFGFWSEQILVCGSDAACIERRTINVSAAYFLSIEFQETGGLVDGLYRASFGRRPFYLEFLPDSSAIAHGVVVGRNGWEQELETKKRAFIEAFVSRAAFRAAYDGLSNDGYVDQLISHTGVNYTASERNALVGSLSDGALTRSAVLQRIAEEERFVNAKRNEAFVMMQYFGYLRRDPDESGYHFWLNKLNQFNGNFEQAEMVRAFLISSEYRQRFAR